MGRTLFLFLIVVRLGAGSATGQPAADRARIAADLREYHALLTAWRGGDDTTVPRVLEWKPERVLPVLAHAEGPLDAVRPWDGRRFEAAAMLHTAAALARLRLEDAALVGAQLDIASRWLERGGPDCRSFAERWYVALARVLADPTWLPTAEHLLQLGRARLRGNPLVLCESGVLAELMATDPAFEADARRQLALKGDGPGRPLSPMAFSDLLKRRAYYLSRAADWLGQAATGSSDMCRLHLGRVLSLQSRYDESAHWLDGISRGSDDATAYLAAMFEGASAERLGRIDEAERNYRLAIARYPSGHAAYFALSSVLQASRRIEEARSILRQAVTSGQDSRREPWWWYFLEPTAAVTDRLDALRREARR